MNLKQIFVIVILILFSSFTYTNIEQNNNELQKWKYLHQELIETPFEKVPSWARTSLINSFHYLKYNETNPEANLEIKNFILKWIVKALLRTAKTNALQRVWRWMFLEKYEKTALIEFIDKWPEQKIQTPIELNSKFDELKILNPVELMRQINNIKNEIKQDILNHLNQSQN